MTTGRATTMSGIASGFAWRLATTSRCVSTSEVSMSRGVLHFQHATACWWFDFQQTWQIHRSPTVMGDSSRSDGRADYPCRGKPRRPLAHRSMSVYRKPILTDAFEALGDPQRRTILQLLGERPRAVGELADELPVSRPAVSFHLRLLKDAGLVEERRQGTRRIYSLRAA